MKNAATCTLKIGAGLLLAAIALALTIGAIRGPIDKNATAAPTTSTTSTTVEEDSPGWDCATMGNHVCGVGSFPLSTYCQVEPNAELPEGVEEIAYPAGLEITRHGLRVDC